MSFYKKYKPKYFSMSSFSQLYGGPVKNTIKIVIIYAIHNCIILFFP